MKKYSFFDIVGPIMIGPSSSHTAGATRLSYAARKIANFPLKKVNYFLMGSFAKTYRGHGTDKALVAGSLGFQPWDERIRSSFKHAKDLELAFGFYPVDEDFDHANTVRIEMIGSEDQKTVVTGASIGGGNILITDINGTPCEYTGQNPTLIIQYPDQKRVIAKVTAVLSDADVNIENIQTSQVEPPLVTLFIEVDEAIDKKYIDKLKSLPGLDFVKYLEKID